MAEAKARYDHVIVDLPAGLDPFVRSMSAAADRLLVVVTEEPTSMTDAYAVLKMHRFDRPAGKGGGGIVVNQAASQTSGRQVHAALTRACIKFLDESPDLAGIVPRDPLVTRAIRHQSLLLLCHPDSSVAAHVESLAQRLM